MSNLISDTKERTQSDDVRGRGAEDSVWVYEGDSSRSRAEVASRVGRLTEIYSYDEIKEEEKVTTCDTRTREEKWRDNSKN